MTDTTLFKTVSRETKFSITQIKLYSTYEDMLHFWDSNHKTFYIFKTYYNNHIGLYYKEGILQKPKKEKSLKPVTEKPLESIFDILDIFKDCAKPNLILVVNNKDK